MAPGGRAAVPRVRARTCRNWGRTRPGRSPQPQVQLTPMGSGLAVEDTIDLYVGKGEQILQWVGYTACSRLAYKRGGGAGLGGTWVAPSHRAHVRCMLPHRVVPMRTAPPPHSPPPSPTLTHPTHPPILVHPSWRTRCLLAATAWPTNSTTRPHRNRCLARAPAQAGPHAEAARNRQTATAAHAAQAPGWGGTSRSQSPTRTGRRWTLTSC
jgi:hypothetical protein